MQTIENDVNSRRAELEASCAQEAMAIVQGQYMNELKAAMIADFKSQGVK